MAIKDIFRRFLGYRLGGAGLTEMLVPPGWNYESYLKAYGNIGWLFGAVSLIANSVAATEWKLYRKTKDGEREEIDNHPLIDLWDHVNPFQTRYQFILLLQTYVSLVGEAFVVLNFNRLGVPAEMWLAPPSRMTVVPSPDTYISHYELRGSSVIRLEIPEVVQIADPNPANPYRGTGAAKAIATDLDAEFYGSRYQQRLFYNDARPGLFLEFPDMPPDDERKRLRSEWNEQHQGWRNAYKTAFLWGGAKANMVTMTNRDMDFTRLRTATRKAILGAFHIPESLMGISDVGSRARAEADEYIFAKYTINPALTRIKEALNEQLCPLIDETLEFDFISPVPEDEAFIRDQNREDFKAGLITREEARLAIGMDADAEGTFLLPFNLMPVPAKTLGGPVRMLPQAKANKWNEEHKEVHWKAYAAKTEAEEKLFIAELHKQWEKQQKEVIKNLRDGAGVDDALFDVGEAEETFSKSFEPIIGKVFENHYLDAQGLVSPENPHTDAILKQNDRAITWINERSLLLAKLLNGTTIEQLRETLADGFAAGESVPKLTKRVEEYYGTANRVRARMVARTETIAASAEGTLEGYMDAGAEQVEFYTAIDERTCDDCMAEHGREYKTGESSGVIPLHPQCRCVWLPVV